MNFSDIFLKLYGVIEESEKNRLIASSGSTKGDSCEKIRSGQSYLYKLHGMESEVIEIRFKNKVWGSHLNAALAETMKRYPYFNTRLVEKNGDFYIVQNEIAPIARKTPKLSRLGGVGCSRHLVDVTYFEHSVFISFHHALCDGRGIKPFAETLLYYYCRSRYKNNEKAEGIRLAGEALLEGETAEPFLQPYEYDESKEFINISRDAFELPESGEPFGRTNYRFELKVPHDEYMSACKANNATPVILLSVLASRAIAALHPSYDKPINANIATDMREALGVKNTYKNCVKSMILPYDRAFSRLTLREECTQYRALLQKQRDFDFCRKEANAMLALFEKLDTLGSYKDKQGIMAFFENMKLNTYVISYLGQFVLGCNEKYIESIRLYNSGAAGLGINMIAAGGSFCIDVKQSFGGDSYAKAIRQQFAALGIGCELSGAVEFFTPADDLIKRK